MKRVYTALVTIVLIIAVCVYSLIRVEGMRREMHAHADVISEAIVKQDYLALTQRAAALADYWKEEEKIIIRFVRRMDVDEITKSIVQLIAYAQHADYTSAAAALSLILGQADHIWESEQITIGNLL